MGRSLPAATGARLSTRGVHAGPIQHATGLDASGALCAPAADRGNTMDQAVIERIAPRPLASVPISAGKRALDVVLAGSGLVMSSPVWAVLAIAIKLEDGGPIFYSQDRAGEAGRVFRAWKFRSMIPDAEKH